MSEAIRGAANAVRREQKILQEALMDMNEHTPLLPCPFCGGPAERHDFPADEADGNAGGSVIQCTRCMASSAVHFDRKENLVSDWNSRSPTLLARVRELEAERDAANARAGDAEEMLRRIGDYAHDKSTGPAIPDALWEIREMAYGTIREAGK